MGEAARKTLTAGAVLAALLATPAAHARGSAEVAALQVVLSGKRLYGGAVDGVRGPATERAIRRFQRRRNLIVDGVVGPQTRRALGRFARHPVGSRVLRPGYRGWDVAELQFLLAWHGFPSGFFDGLFGPRVHRAVIRFQRWAGLAADGRAGPATFGALRAPAPTIGFSLAAPVVAPIGDRFGPRGQRFHAGIDFPAAAGASVRAAARGRITYAGWLPGGYGYAVSIAHGAGVRTLYAHLSRVDVRVGQRVGLQARVGLIGSTGNATGPHLHFEVRIRGAAVDPLRVLHLG